MKLVASKTSPYARKIRVLLAEKQLAFEFVEESAWNAGHHRSAVQPAQQDSRCWSPTTAPASTTRA